MAKSRVPSKKRIAGFLFHGDKIHWAALDGPVESVSLHDKGDIAIPEDHAEPQYVAWALTVLTDLLNRINPDLVVYQLTRALDRNDQIIHIYFGLAALNLAAERNKVPCTHVAPNSLKPHLMGQGWQKDDNLQACVHELFPGVGKPWNANTRNAVAIALRKFS